MAYRGHRSLFGRKRKREGIIGRTIQTGIGEDKDSSGYGFIIIPSDMDREDYINYVYRTGTCFIMTSFNEVWRNVRIPSNIMSEIIFPEDPEEYGQAVGWVNIPTVNQVTIYGILMSPDEIYAYDQYTKSRAYKGKGVSFNEVISANNTPNYSAVLQNDFEESGEINWMAIGSSGKSCLTLKLNGTSILYSDYINTIQSYDEVDIIVGSEDTENLSTLKIKNDGTFEYIDSNGNYVKIEKGKTIVESKDGEILLGEGATEAAFLGDKASDWLGKVMDGLAVLTVPTAMGPSGPPVNSATFTTLKAQLTTLLSTKNKVE